VKQSTTLLSKFLLLLIVASVPRLAFLNLIPQGLNYDEIDYVINAKTVYYSWTDISGRWHPLSLTTLPDESPKGELPPVILAPFIGPFPFSLFSSKLPFAIFGILLVGLIYAISRKLFGEKKAFLSALVVALNPLAIFNSRIGYDGPLTATLYLAAFTILLYAKRWFILLSLIPFFLGFYCYIGTKLIFLPFTLLSLLFSWKVVNKGRYTKQYFLVGLVATIIFLNFLLRLSSLPSGDRAVTLFSPFHPNIALRVDDQRRQSLILPINSLDVLAVNKIVIYLKEIIGRAFGAFSSSLLFFSGDVYHFFYLWDHGVLYYTDFFFLFIGLYFLVKKYHKTAVFFAFLFPVLLLPSVFSSTDLSYVYRSYLLYIFLAAIVGLGMWHFINRFKNKAKLVIPALLVVYTLQFINFAYDYFIRNPVYHQDQSQFTFRVLSRYLVEEAKTGRQLVVTGLNPRQIFQYYILYSGLINQLDDKDIRNMLAQRFTGKQFKWNNIVFTDDCHRPTLAKQETLIMHDAYYCENIQKDLIDHYDDYLAVARISDSGHEFRIFYGKTCEGITSQTYVRSVSFSDLKVESLPLTQYCNTFIVKNFKPAVVD